MSEGRIAARVFYLFDKGRELREIVEELEIPPGVVRDLWHEWLMDLDEGEENRRKSAQEERKRRAEEGSSASWSAGTSRSSRTSRRSWRRWRAPVAKLAASGPATVHASTMSSVGRFGSCACRGDQTKTRAA